MTEPLPSWPDSPEEGAVHPGAVRVSRARRLTRRPLGALGLDWPRQQGPKAGTQRARLTQGERPVTTLDESVVSALIQALYDALPDDLGQADDLPERTFSGNIVGRPRGRRLSSALRHAAAPSVPNDEPRPRGAASVEGSEPQPRQYVRGLPDPATLQATRLHLPALGLDLPPEGHLLSAREVLGYGEACFLRAQSALWAWRTHRQPNLELHADGPPAPGRHVLLEQRLGPLTLLLGHRVTELHEGERHWGFTLGSLSEQVVRSWECFRVTWQPDDAVVFTFESRQQIGMPRLNMLGPVYAAVRRTTTQGYLRNMREMTADADL